MCRAKRTLKDRSPELHVRNVMRTQIATILPDTGLPEIIRRLQDADLHEMPVLDRGAVVGIVTRGDVRAAGASSLSLMHHHDRPEAVRALTAADVMSRPVVTVAANATVTAAARLLLQHAIRTLPVMRNHQLVGLLTAEDILRLLCDSVGSGSAPYRTRAVAYETTPTEQPAVPVHR